MNDESIPELIPTDPPRWTVATLNAGAKNEYHALLYGEREISTLKGPRGLDQLRDQASLFNRKKSVPRDEPGPASGAADDTTAPLVFDETTPIDPMKPNPKAKILEQAAVVDIPQSHAADQFRRYPQNRLVKPEHVKSLRDSIKEVGLINAVLARPIPGAQPGEGVWLELIAGEGRWLGCCGIDPKYPVRVIVRDLNDKDAAKLHAIENFQREDLDEIEEAVAIKNMRDNGWSIDEVREFLKKEKSYIYKRLELLKLSDEGRQALRDRNISISTAAKIIALPADRQDEALKAVVSPTHAKEALSEREALSLIEREFVEPLKKAQEWKERRNVLEMDDPATEWVPYEEARKLGAYESQYVQAMQQPGWDLRSDAARSGELVVPTWYDLAKRHGGRILIGLRPHGDDAYLFVDPIPLIEAEKVAHDEKPQDCIFTHPKSVQQNKDAAARKKLEEEKRKQDELEQKEALRGERKLIIDAIVFGEILGLTKEKQFAESIALSLCANGWLEDSYIEMGLVLGIETAGQEIEETEPKMHAAIRKMMRAKVGGGFEALGRFISAVFVASHEHAWNLGFEELAQMVMKDGVFKPAIIPQLAALKEAEDKAQAEREKEAHEEPADAA